MPERTLRVRGARTHNLKDLDLDVPREAFTAVCGVSGSGKSSLVLDTLAAESRRRLLGALARAEAEALARPDVDSIEGLPPAVAVGFSSRAPGPRQTLGTLSEVTHALRALYLRAAVPQCPRCEGPLSVRTRESILGALLALPADTRVTLLAPLGAGPQALREAARRGFVRARVEGGDPGRLEDLSDGAVPDDARVEVVIDRLVVKDGARERFAASVDQTLSVGDGRLVAIQAPPDGPAREEAMGDRPWCGRCGAAWPPLSMAGLSFNSPSGACPRCQGEGEVARGKGERPRPCADCQGARLGPYPRAARLGGLGLPEAEALSVRDLAKWLDALPLEGQTAALCAPALEDARARLAFLDEVGLGYLALGRAAKTLSGGELQRARLAAACAARMSGLLFLLDEPTAGLHPAERPALVARLRALVEAGNTLLCVEHDPRALREADFVLELGPGSGREGGRIVFQGPPKGLLRAADSPTGAALREPDRPWRAAPRDTCVARIEGRGARLRTLRGVDFDLPVPGLTVVCGVSGAGKSTLALEVVAPAVVAAIEGRTRRAAGPLRLSGARAVDRVVVARAHAPRQARATAGGVLGALSPLREVYAATLEARARGWGPRWFSTHVAGGRCADCEGTGTRTVRMRDLPAHRMPCDACGGTRFCAEAQRVRVKGWSIAETLALPIAEAAQAFRDLPRVAAPLAAAAEVGLGHVTLGESPARLSGGEALRLSLAAALGKGARTRTLYVLDEPAAGLHPLDARHLMEVLERLTAADHAVLAVEHHPEALRRADHLIELGPGPAEAGGRVVYAGPPAGLLQASTPTAEAARVR